MVLLTILNFAKDKKLPRQFLRSRFIDSLKIYVKGGSGGTGLPKYGGVGGQGGCVYCVGKEGALLKTVLAKYPKRRVVAAHGGDSVRNKILGNPGQDQMLEVPLGVTVYRQDGKLLGEINKEGETCLLARGGPGGNIKNNFLGFEGQKHIVRLDLRLIADIGLVGFPNAGKSSLLKSISRAKPKIANYPFTTIRPNLGSIVFPDLRQITVADLPGLIEGAHINIGLGHKFLKHVERTKMLLLIVDIQGFRLSQMHSERSCLETILLLNKELEMYNSELLDKPAILAINKLDVEEGSAKYEEIKESINNLEKYKESLPTELQPDKIIKFQKVIGISALTGQNVEPLKSLMRSLLDQYAEETDSSIKTPSEVIKKFTSSITERGPKIT